MNIQQKHFIKNETLQQIIKYLFVGGTCTVLDFGILYVLTHYFNIYYILSSTISFTAGTVLNYYLCTLWIFKVRKIDNKKMEFFYYLLITAIGLCITVFVIWIVTEYYKLNFMISKIVATFITVWWNFIARKVFLHTIR